MARMKREEWYNIARDVDWTRSYVDEEAVFPEWLSGSGKVPREAWKSWDEPYKCAYSDYVATQREKEGSVYAVKAALQRSNIFESLDEGWKSTAKAHFGAVSLIEYLAVLAEQRMGRFGLSPAWRNMAGFEALDEARHAQQGGPTLEILMQHDPKRAQWMIDKTFWISARLFSILTGPGMDYYTPLEHRKQSYKEFMEEWIVAEFLRLIEDYGLKKPWYWEEFLAGLETWHHSLHLGVWFWRPTVWWKPQGGVSKAERAWLQEKYPHWEEQWGPIWDTLIQNINAGNMGGTLPETLPWLCNLCHLPIGTAASPNNPKYPVRSYPLTHNGYTYHFCSRPCRQIWWEDKDMLHQKTIIEHLLAREIQPPDVAGILAWMGLTPEIMGDDAYNYKWAEEYREPAPVAGAEGGSHA